LREVQHQEFYQKEVVKTKQRQKETKGEELMKTNKKTPKGITRREALRLYGMVLGALTLETQKALSEQTMN